MRKESFGIGDYIHVYNRGNRKQAIVKSTADRDHFLQMLFYFNTESTPPNPFFDLRSKLRLNLNSFIWPENWQPRKQIVKILSFALMENHFHLILQEITEGGVAKFMQRLGTGLVMYFNTKYKETGRLFQGSYKAKLVDKDLYLNYLSVYVQVKNIFELYPGGLAKVVREFDKIYDFATKFPYGSLPYFLGNIDKQIIDKELLKSTFPKPADYKKFARECIIMNLDEKLGDLTLAN
ncbi:MAG: transposase [Parcubacteria group bacterium Gr01-1014_44]|nr:MAG: transposase [Parcubacteria group bacterium Gr01-1014_44]